MATKTKKRSESLTKKKAVLIIDDHPLYREGLSQYINKENDLEVCGEASNAVDGLEMIRKKKPDLVTVDVTLGESSGIDLVKMIKAQNETLPVLVVSMHPDSLYAERALSAGARGYINKGKATENVMEAIRSILKGRIYLSEEMTQSMLEKKTHGVPETSSTISLLSDRELEVFELIGSGKTTNHIAKNLHLSNKTIETYRANIKNKLSLNNNTELIQHAVQWVRDGKVK